MSKQLIQVSLDGGMTFQDAPKGIRLIVKNMPTFQGDQEKNGELRVLATHNGFLALNTKATKQILEKLHFSVPQM